MRSDDAQADESIQSVPEPTREEAVELGRDTRMRVMDFFYAERWTWISFAVHTLALACMMLMPPKSSALALDMLSDDVRYARYLAAPIERDDFEALDFGANDVADGAKAKGDEGKAGEPQAPRKVKRMSGGSRTPTAEQDVRESVRTAGILGVLNSQAARINHEGDFNVDGAGGGALSALGALYGTEIGASEGFNGLGLSHAGRGGGGDALGSVGVGPVGAGLGRGGCPGCVPTLGGPHREARVPRLRMSNDTEVRGSMSKEVIRRVIQRHLNEVRFCYEEGLRGAPELEGRVEVKFVIAPSGVVQASDVKSSNLAGDRANTAHCIAAAVRRWSFPAPDGGGVVIVTYPFLLQSGG